jgi:hypothetical protein
MKDLNELPMDRSDNILRIPLKNLDIFVNFAVEAMCKNIDYEDIIDFAIVTGLISRMENYVSDKTPIH